MQLYREYETVALLHPDTLEDGVHRFNHKVSDVVGREQGILLKVDSWGKKKLAYEVKKETKGIYTYYRYLGTPKTVSELERTLRFADTCLRYQTVHLADRVKVEDRPVEDSAKTDFLVAAEAAVKAAADAANRPPAPEVAEVAPVAAAAVDADADGDGDGDGDGDDSDDEQA